jgi:hypothetical protein
MEKRQIRMEDGRYLIFYTFAPSGAAPNEMDAAENLEGAARDSEPAVKPEAEEERSV